MTYQHIADYLIALSNETGNLISNLKLQKLMYYAQAWYLAIHRKPLFEASFEAWVHGPVLRKLFDEYSHFRWKPIQRDDLSEEYLEWFEAEFGEEVNEFMDNLVDEYFGLTAYHLERLTHLEEPWRRARNGLPEDAPSTNVIENDWMRDFYERFVKVDG